MTVDHFNDPNWILWFWDVIPLLFMLSVVHKLMEMSVSNQLFQESFVSPVVFSQVTLFLVVSTEWF